MKTSPPSVSESVQTRHPYESPAALLQSLTGDAAHDIGLLQQQAGRWPQHLQLTLARVGALKELGRLDEALSFVREALKVRVHEALRWAECELLLLLGREPEVKQLATQWVSDPQVEVQALGQRLFARITIQKGQPESAMVHLKRACELSPKKVQVHMQAAELAQELQLWEEALRLYGVVAEIKGEAGPWDIERVALGSRLGDWEAVRDSGQRLGLSLGAGSGAPQADWGLCYVAVNEFLCKARRTGPATAIILEADAGCTLKTNDLVAISTAPEDTDEALSRFDFIATIEQGVKQERER